MKGLSLCGGVAVVVMGVNDDESNEWAQGGHKDARRRNRGTSHNGLLGIS